MPVAVVVLGVLLIVCARGHGASGRTGASRDDADEDVGLEGDVGGPYGWGETCPGSIATTVSAPQAVSTSATAQPEPHAAAWAVEITLSNSGDQPFSPSMLQILGRNGTYPAQQVFDGATGFHGMVGVGPIPVGQTVTVPVAFLGGPGAPSVLVASMSGEVTVTFAYPNLVE